MTLIRTLNIFFQNTCTTIQIISNNTYNNNRTSTQIIPNKKMVHKRVFHANNAQATILRSVSIKLKESY